MRICFSPTLIFRRYFSKSSSMTLIKNPLKIKLNERETLICDYVMRFVREKQLNITCRIAGGWVRDKLLGVESDDIDIALDTMTGHQFAESLSQWESEQHLPLHRIGKIQANPEKSKHLETATIDLFGQSVDFVNLRNETYETTSSTANEASSNNAANLVAISEGVNGAGGGAGGGGRIPITVSFGSPLEDALRRDLTINSLFYNIETGLVEDWTEKGISDLLEVPLIRTPLPPRETFLDDPLRILRCIRFAARFEFPMDQGIIPAVRDPIVRQALREKVSRERIGIEMAKIFKVKNPWVGLNLLRQGEIYSVIFDSPEVCDEITFEFDGRGFSGFLTSLSDSYESELDGFMARIEPITLELSKNAPFNLESVIESKKLYYALICILPFYGWDCVRTRKTPASKSKPKHISVPFSLVSDALKWPNKDAKFVAFVLDEGIHLIKNLASKIDLARKDRGMVGLALRKLGANWKICLFMAAAHSALGSELTLDQTIDLYFKQLWDIIVREHVFFPENGASTFPWENEPLIRGNELIDLGIPKGEISNALDQVHYLQFQDPYIQKETLTRKILEWNKK